MRVNKSSQSKANFFVFAIIAFLTQGVVALGQEIATFQGLGIPSGSSESGATSVSDNGSVVVGYMRGTFGEQAFRWTLESGMVGLGDFEGGEFKSGATDVSADGSVVVGVGTSGLGDEAFRWTQAGGLKKLKNLLPNRPNSRAYGISADGSMIAGDINNGGNYNACRWVQEGDPIPLNDFHSASNAISANGSFIVGWVYGASGFEAFRWAQDGTIIGLGDLGGGRFESVAIDVSADGSVVVGYGLSASGYEAFRWTQDGMIPLGDLPGGIYESEADGVSADGKIIVGYGSSASGYEAFIWDSTHGMRNLRDVLVNDYRLGTALAGWKLRFAYAISADGNTIVGIGTNPSGQTEGWIVRLLKVTTNDLMNQPTVEIQPSILSFSGQGPNPEQRKVLQVNIKGVMNTTYKAYVQPEELSGGHEHSGTTTAPRVHGWLKKTYSANFPNYQLGSNNPNYAAGTVDNSDFNGGLSFTTNDNGDATLYYYAPEISGREKIYVSTIHPTSALRTIASTVVTLRIPDLQILPESNFIKHIGGTIAHSNSVSHNGTTKLIKALKALAINYFSETGRQLPVNDMSLPSGGLFDIFAPFWKPPHIGHRRGEEADLGLLPGNTVFDGLLREQGWWILNPAFWASEATHYHLNLSGDGKVTIKGTSGQVPEPPSVVATWANTQHTQLNITLNLSNHGGLDAQSVSISDLQFSHPAPQGTTFNSLATLPLNYGSMTIRAMSSQTFQVQVTQAAAPLTVFGLRVTGTAASSNGAFPFVIDFIVRPQ